MLVATWGHPSATAQQNSNTQADTILHGLVFDLRSDEPLPYVLITNLETGIQVESGSGGQFSIPVKKNQLLEFRNIGYRTDSVFVVEHAFKRIYLSSADGNIIIDAVTIRGMTNAQLDQEIEKARKEGQFVETSQSRGGIRLSPSRLFGDAGKNARLHYDLLLGEKDRRIIDQRFSVAAIQAVTPLEGEDLELFMTKFRPTSAFILKTSDQDFMLYIMDSYAKYKALSAEEKSQIKIKTNGS